MGMELAAYVPRLAGRLLAAGPPGTAHVLDGTLAFYDVSGFTRLSERLARAGRIGAELTKAAINAVFEPAIGALLDAGGDVLKFGGDALLVWFDGPGHAEQAAVASAGLQRLIATVGRVESASGPVRLRMSAGLESGPVTFVLAPRPHHDLLVAGTTVDATLRLEAAAAAGQVLVGPSASGQLRPAWTAGERLRVG
ncbi:MAG: adenylate/guanylate cyclase domain-containing protein, partial [Acidimicrobiia bacterium]|nr:adenylate/guanylate cyclase domain-containing protein [Acidimicrobiia bacterium]